MNVSPYQGGYPGAHQSPYGAPGVPLAQYIPASVHQYIPQDVLALTPVPANYGPSPYQPQPYAPQPYQPYPPQPYAPQPYQPYPPQPGTQPWNWNWAPQNIRGNIDHILNNFQGILQQWLR